jgi:hypothetical protein
MYVTSCARSFAIAQCAHQPWRPLATPAGSYAQDATSIGRVKLFTDTLSLAARGASKTPAVARPLGTSQLPPDSTTSPSAFAVSLPHPLDPHPSADCLLIHMDGDPVGGADSCTPTMRILMNPTAPPIRMHALEIGTLGYKIRTLRTTRLGQGL